MDTIKTHHNRLAARYRPRTNAARVIPSAKKLAYLILASHELLEAHSRKMLKQVLWLLTEAHGKYSTRYRSAEVVRLARENPDSDIPIRHEHVYPRAIVARQILTRRLEFLQFPTRLDDLLDQKAVACIVTVAQHEQLLEGEGWARYANVPVLDMSVEPPAPLMV
jgi:hypothetical protein